MNSQTAIPPGHIHHEPMQCPTSWAPHIPNPYLDLTEEETQQQTGHAHHTTKEQHPGFQRRSMRRPASEFHPIHPFTFKDKEHAQREDSSESSPDSINKSAHPHTRPGLQVFSTPHQARSVNAINFIQTFPEPSKRHKSMVHLSHLNTDLTNGTQEIAKDTWSPTLGGMRDISSLPRKPSKLGRVKRMFSLKKREFGVAPKQGKFGEDDL
jgi:hypothetical protein